VLVSFDDAAAGGDAAGRSAAPPQAGGTIAAARRAGRACRLVLRNPLAGSPIRRRPGLVRVGVLFRARRRQPGGTAAYGQRMRALRSGLRRCRASQDRRSHLSVSGLRAAYAVLRAVRRRRLTYCTVSITGALDLPPTVTTTGCGPGE